MIRVNTPLGVAELTLRGEILPSKLQRELARRAKTSAEFEEARKEAASKATMNFLTSPPGLLMAGGAIAFVWMHHRRREAENG